MIVRGAPPLLRRVRRRLLAVAGAGLGRLVQTRPHHRLLGPRCRVRALQAAPARVQGVGHTSGACLPRGEIRARRAAWPALGRARGRLRLGAVRERAWVQLRDPGPARRRRLGGVRARLWGAAARASGAASRGRAAEAASDRLLCTCAFAAALRTCRTGRCWPHEPKAAGAWLGRAAHLTALRVCGSGSR